MRSRLPRPLRAVFAAGLVLVAAPAIPLAALVLAVAVVAPAPLAAQPAAPIAASGAAPAPKLFAVTFTTGPKWDAAKPPQAQAFFKEHSDHLARLRAEQHSVLGGRYADKGLLLVRAAAEADVRALLARDPSLAAGTFQATVDEYRPFQHGDTRPPLATPEAAVIRAVLAAYNARDTAAVLAHFAPDAQLTSLDPAAANLDLATPAALGRWLDGVFAAAPDLRCELLDLTQAGAHVSYRERTTFTAQDGQRRTQTSLAVYEVRAGKITRAWFYPSTKL